MSGIIKIPLTKGYVAIIDQCDEALAAHKWHAAEDGSGRVYARRSVLRSNGTMDTIYLHGEIIGDACVGLPVDQIDGDGINNRRGNLRAVDPEVNQHNRAGALRNSKSGVLGVHWHARDQRWQARIRFNNTRIHLGNFETIEDAKAARLAAEAKYWGIQPRRVAAHAEGGE